MTTAPVQRPLARPDLRWLFDAYLQTQKLRIAIGNRIAAVERESDQAPISASIELLHRNLATAEAGIKRDMDTALEGHPAMDWLGRVKGIGPTLATKMLGLIDDITPFTTASKLWRYSGLAVIDGKRERPTGAFCPDCGSKGRKKEHVCPVTGATVAIVGGKLHYNTKLKTTMYLVAGSFLKCGSPYVALYHEARTKYLQRATGKGWSWCEDVLTRLGVAEEGKARTAVLQEIEDSRLPDSWTLGHQHLAALRIMEKMFLVHLWKTWREKLGLPTPAPYIFAHPGAAPHTDELDPWDFVEPEEV